MPKRAKDLLVGLFTAIASTVVSLLVLTRVLKERKSEEQVAESEGNTVKEAEDKKDTKGEANANAGERPQALAAAQAAFSTGWGIPRPEKLSPPTYWPVVMALGITVVMWGLATTFLLSGVGLLLFGLALAGWVGEMRGEGRQ